MKWRLLCVAVTFLALFLVFRKIPPATLFQTIRAMHAGWFIAGVAIYGAMFLPAAVRWRLALRANDAVVSWPATFRFTLIGHFFYLILFGGTGGDAAKATIYARRHQFPLPNLFASVWLDRLMGSGALLVVAVVAFTIAAFHGGFTGAQSLSVRGSFWWLLLIIPALALFLFWLRRSRHESFLRRLAVAFLEGAKRLIKSPKRLAVGFICSLLMQCAVNGLLALNLQAVSHAPIPWLRLLWTFPLITTISGLPVTVAGIGARDGAAIALLGWCGVPAADAEAMSLLTLCVSVLWGLIGGIILWRESGRATHKRKEPGPTGSQPL
ncbi:MAG TPA: lysylphosphatidylglycerol synthase transmembrane domain-containing protein [Verrucomicrobiae bacterium]|nr:lysylphosphatidylglycerol synthase transmembrane domain-containing protein [Verrucomicrobiae bacterium]